MSDDGVAMIPAPPSLDAECEIQNDTTASDGPSQNSVFAAIAQVRAKTGTLRPEELILQKLPVPTDQASPSSLKENSESGNFAPMISASKETEKEINLEDIPSSDSVPERPSFEQTFEEQAPDDPSTAAESTIPAPPSFETSDKEADESGAVNSFLSRLGVGVSASKDSVNMSSAESTYTGSRSGSAALEVQPESVEEIAAIIDAVREKHQAREALREPAGASPSETDDNSYHGDDENPFVDYFLSEKSFESDSVEEKKVDDGSVDFKTSFGNESFAADIRKTLSTVQEVASVEVEDDEENTDALHRDNALSSFDDDGQREPKGVYEKAKVEVEEKLQAQSHEANELASVGGYSDNAWAIRDVASEETLPATGRRRPQVILSGVKPSQKSRNAVSLFDEISQQPSETLSEFRMGLSFGVSSDDFDDHEDKEIGTNGNKETNTNTNFVIETSDSVEEDNRCMIDSFLYNRYEPEHEVPLLQGGDQKDKTSLRDTGEVRTTQQLLGIEVSDVYIPKYIPNEQSTDKQVEAAASTKPTEDASLEEQNVEEESNPFLRQFEALEIEDDDEKIPPENDPEVAKVPVDPEPDVVLKSEDLVKDDAGDPVEDSVEEPVEELVIDPTDDMSPANLTKYFKNIDRLKSVGEKEDELRKELKSLMMPIVNGKIPSVIEEARIRTAALKADVSLQFVDTFINYAKDQKLEVSPQISTGQPSQEQEDIENLNEDVALVTFLSSKSEVKDVCETAEETRKTDEEQQQSEEEQLEGNLSDDSTAETEEDETDGEDEREESKGHADVANDTSLETPMDHESYDKDRPDPIDEEMLRACSKIEEYDEWVWYRRAAMATHGWDRESRNWQSSQTSPQALSYTPRGGFQRWAPSRDVSNYMFNKRSFPFSRKYCKLSRKRRLRSHTGYSDVDVFSLQEAAMTCGKDSKSMYEIASEELRNVGQRLLNESLQEYVTNEKENKSIDETSWEFRNVRQGFLHERSLTFSRNWFGDLVETSGNDKIKAPICKPKSMQMPMRNIPDPGDWTPEWYTPWGGRKLHKRRPSLDSSVDSLGDSYTDRRHNDDDTRGSYSSAESSYSDDDWEDAPECGTLVNTKLKIGEPVSRVHPDYTSSLLKSRWRNKYFPIGPLP